MIQVNERPYPYLIAVGNLIDAVQKIHSTKPGTSPLSLEQILFWLRQISLEDLKNAGPARQRERELRESSRREAAAANEEEVHTKDGPNPRNLFLVA
jgi:hypothetical protein